MANLITEIASVVPASVFNYTGTVIASETSNVNPPSNIIRTSETWFVQFDWAVTGWLHPILDSNCEWRMEVFAEQMGPLEANSLVGPAPKKIHAYNPVPPALTPFTYTAIETFPAGSLAAGLYRLTAIIKLVDQNGHPLPVTGFADVGLYEFFDVV